jgi:P27 family predicted phage terminase small subunit
MKGTKPALRQASDAVTRVPSAPKWLSDHARAEWKRVLPSLVDRRILTPADLGSVENYCVSIGRVREIEATMQKGGIDPVFARMQDKAMTTARQLAAELGLTPVSRSRPSVRNDNDDSEDSPLDV